MAHYKCKRTGLRIIRTQDVMSRKGQGQPYNVEPLTEPGCPTLHPPCYEVNTRSNNKITNAVNLTGIHRHYSACIHIIFKGRNETHFLSGECNVSNSRVMRGKTSFFLVIARGRSVPIHIYRPNTRHFTRVN